MFDEDKIIQTVILLKASVYKIVDSETGRIVEGVTSFYYPYKGVKAPIDNHVKQRDEDTDDTYGSDAVKVSFPIEYWELITTHGAPAVYRFTKEMGIDSQTRKEKVKVTDVSFVGYLNPMLLQEFPKTEQKKPS